MSEDMLPYCSAHDEWLIMKHCMYVGYHTANNVYFFLKTSWPYQPKHSPSICSKVTKECVLLT